MIKYINNLLKLIKNSKFFLNKNTLVIQSPAKHLRWCVLWKNIYIKTIKYYFQY